MKLQMFMLFATLLYTASCSEQKDHKKNEFQHREKFQESIKRWDAYSEAVREHWQTLPHDAYINLIKEAAQVNPHAIEFKKVYPQAYQTSGRTTIVLRRPQRSPPELSKHDIAPDRLVFIAPLHGRYELRCTIPFYLSPDYKTVDEFKDPYYELYYTVKIKESYTGRKIRVGGQRPFIFHWGATKLDLEDWEQFKANNYDWEKIKVQLVKDDPLPDFESFLPKSI